MYAYKQEQNLSVAHFVDILTRSTLAERRPVDDLQRIQTMLDNSNLIITAKDKEGKYIGVARAFSDKGFFTYLSDLAVDQAYKGQGIGIELIRQVKLAYPLAKVVLISAPKAVDFYPKTGMTRHEHCWMLDDVNDLKG